MGAEALKFEAADSQVFKTEIADDKMNLTWHTSRKRDIGSSLLRLIPSQLL